MILLKALKYRHIQACFAQLASKAFAVQPSVTLPLGGRLVLACTGSRLFSLADRHVLTSREINYVKNN
jgi:hypothetical protein